MKYLYLLPFLLFVACNGNEKNAKQADPETPPKEEKIVEEKNTDTTFLSKGKTFSNERFRQVTIQRKGKHTFKVEGEARLFEGTYNWVIEDGHHVLKEGYGTAEIGAPEWGKFSFTFEVEKKEPNSVLHLILFEPSAKDNSRQHELIIPLY